MSTKAKNFHENRQLGPLDYSTWGKNNNNSISSLVIAVSCVFKDKQLLQCMDSTEGRSGRG